MECLKGLKRRIFGFSLLGDELVRRGWGGGGGGGGVERNFEIV